MSVIGDESANASLGLITKGADISADLLKAFLGWLINLRSRHLENELKRETINATKTDKGLKNEQIKMMKSFTETAKAKKAIQEGRGIVQAQELYKSDLPLSAGATALNPQQQRDFARYAKSFGMTYSLIENGAETGNNKLILFPEKDLQKVKDITDRMTQDAQIKEINRRIGQLKAKGVENFTKQDYADLTALEALRDNKITDPIEALNKAGSEKTFEEISGEYLEQRKLGTQPMDFDRAMNHITERDWYVSNEPYYVAERSNPTNYIEINSRRETDHRGQEYTKSYYSVYADGEKTADLDDGRFEGRKPGYWQSVKDEMREKGSFTDDVIIFKTKGEFDQYVETYNRSVERLEGQDLDATLYDVGAYFDDAVGEGIDYESGQTTQDRLSGVGVGDKNPDGERLRLTKGLLIADQIKIQKNLQILETEEAKVNYLISSTAPAPRDLMYLQKRLEGLQTEENSYKEIGREKTAQLKKLLGVEALETITYNRLAETRALQHPGKDAENGAILNNIENLAKNDWSTTMNLAHVLKPAGPAIPQPQLQR